MGINLGMLRDYVDGSLDESAVAELQDAATAYDLDSDEFAS